MTSNAERVEDGVKKLTRGWSEIISYHVLDAHMHPVSRSRVVTFDGLLVQLERLSRELPNVISGNGGSNPNKSTSRPPLNFSPLHLIDDITDEAIKLRKEMWLLANAPRSMLHQQGTVKVLGDLVTLTRIISSHNQVIMWHVADRVDAWATRALVMLHYEERQVVLANSVCHSCRSDLIVAADGSSDVHCSRCDVMYPQDVWLDLLVGD